MADQVRLGRMAGIPVRAHWTVLVIVALLTWGLAAGALPRTAPGHSPSGYWTAGFVAAVLLVGSVLAHEVGHAVVARRCGMKVEGITLWAFGGVSSFADEAPSPRVELRVALVGPGISLAVAVVSGAVAALLRLAGANALLVAAATWLAGVNLLLAVFNLVPGAPLDGGRVLRALLWQHHGDRARAARTAVRAGRTVGYLLVLLGLLGLVYGDTVDGLWLALIGWFLMSAANAEGAAGTAELLLSDVTVGDVMSTPVETGPDHLTVAAFVEQRVLSGRHSAYPVTDLDGTVTGLVTLTQLRSVPVAAREGTRVRQVAVPWSRLTVAAPDEPLVALLHRMTPASGRRAVVLDGGRLVGIVTTADVTRALAARRLRTTSG